MKDLENILMVISKDVDCSLVMEKAQQLAAAAHAKTFVVRVTYDSIVESPLTDAESIERVKNYVMESEETELAGLIEEYRGRFGAIESATVWHKRQWQGIIDVASDLNADLIIKVANLEPRLQEVVHTPDDWNLLRHANCPVMLLKPQAWVSEPAVIAAVDMLDDGHDEMNAAVLREAAALTAVLGGRLHVVNAYPLFEPWVGEMGAGASFDEIKETVESDLSTRISEQAAATGVSYHMAHIREGKPSMVIKDVVDECMADLVVMGTVGRTGVPGLVLGNTSESVLQVVNTDVVTLRSK